MAASVSVGKLAIPALVTKAQQSRVHVTCRGPEA